MKRTIKWLGPTLLVLLLLLALGVFALQRWMGSADLRTRVAHEASAALGVAVTLGRMDVALWPLPALALGDIELQTRPALTLERVEVRPTWSGLLQGRLELTTVIVRRAVLPQPAIRAILEALQKKKRATSENKGLEMDSALKFLPRSVVLDGVTWVDAKGAAITLQADASLDPDGLPRELKLQVLQGRLQGARLALLRAGNAWDVALDVGGGSVKGQIELQPAAQPGSEFTLKGQLQTRDVEVSALTAATPDKAHAQPLSGRLEASTSLSVSASNPAALADLLQTQSRFTVQKAVLHGVDLARAVKTVGLSRGGETRLDTLAGQVHTQGRTVQLSHLVASSGVLSANGNVAVTPSKHLSGRISVELAGAVGVPLVVGGTLDAPEVTLTRGALIGAAVGTVLMPGVGTGAGASVGGSVGEGLQKFFGK